MLTVLSTPVWLTLETAKCKVAIVLSGAVVLDALDRSRTDQMACIDSEMQPST
jgi:hypothetical protein